MEILREEFLNYMTPPFEGRPLFAELFGLLIGLEEEWRAQGPSEEEIALTAFGFDSWRRHNVGVETGAITPFKEELIEEAADSKIFRNRYGCVSKLMKTAATIPLPMTYPVTDWDSWLNVKPWYEWQHERLGAEWAAAAVNARSDGAVICVSIPGGFDEPRQLMGEEALCIACYEAPDLIHDMLETIGATCERALDIITREVMVDRLFVHEDMAGRSGPLFGPAQVREFIAPYYKRCWQIVEGRGGRLFQQDSDGDMRPIIDAFLETGLNCMYPMEPAAGMDMVAIREKYGLSLSILGGIDKHILRSSKEAIRKELEYKLQPIMRRGTVFGLDHRIPNGTPIENYRYYVRATREILGLDPNPAPCWERFA